jgi:hypothetical protein
MGIAFVNGSYNQNDTGSAATSIAAAALAVTSGNAIIVGVYTYSGDPSNCQDTAGNNYSKLGTYLDGTTSRRLTFYLAQDITGHASNVVTVTFPSSTYPRLCVAHLLGVAKSGAHDTGFAPAGNYDTSSPFTTTAGTTKNDGEWIFGIYDGIGTGPYANSSPSVVRVNIAGSYSDFCLATNLISSAGSGSVSAADGNTIGQAVCYSKALRPAEVEVIKVIDPDLGAGADYDSLYDWEAAQQGDLTGARNEIAVASRVCTGGSSDDTNVVLDGWTVSSTQYIKITSPSEYRHNGKWDATKSRHKITTASGETAAILNHESYTIIEWQQIDVAPASSGGNGVATDGIFAAGDVNPTDITVRNCIVRKSNNNVQEIEIGILFICSSGSTSNHRCYRNIVYGFNDGSDSLFSAGICFAEENSTTIAGLIYNNTVYGCKNGIVLCADDAAFTGAINLKNNFSAGNSGTAYYFDSPAALTSAKNISSDTTSPNGASYQNKTAYSDYFVDYAASDFHLKSTDTVLKDAGDNLGSPYDVDIDGQTVTDTWDIGADEYVVTIIEGSTCWGHVTGVTQTNVRAFTNWTGTGTIENSGDTERLKLAPGEYMESEVVNTGAGTITIDKDAYPQYFGNEASDTNDSPSIATIWLMHEYTCPGYGPQNIQELSLKCYQTQAVNIRLGVYTTAGVLVAEGTGQVAVSANGGVPTWQGHMTQAAVKAAGGASPGVLQGGTNYLFAYSMDVTAVLHDRVLVTGASGELRYAIDVDSTGGMPANLPSYESGGTAEVALRCKVVKA